MAAAKKKKAPARSSNPPARKSVDDVLALLEHKGTKSARDSLPKFGIEVKRAFGVNVGTLRQIAKTIGPDHELAGQLWAADWYESRMLATFVDDPAAVTAAQMERWCRDFDNWAIVDTACFALFDRTAHAWSKLEPWSKRSAEFQKRAAFALLWSLTVHDKSASDDQFRAGLALIELEAEDDRHFVKKAINMALRATGKRNPSLYKAAIEVARRLAASKNAHARWIGSDALRELAGAKVRQRVASKEKRA